MAPPEAVPSTESGPGDKKPWLCDFQMQNSWKAEEKAIFFLEFARESNIFLDPEPSIFLGGLDIFK